MTEEKPKAYALDDPTVVRLGAFLRNTPLTNGQFAPIPDPLSEYVAQAVVNYTQGLVWSGETEQYIALGDWESTPDMGDVQVENISGEVTRIVHRTTGISALGETPDEAWKLLREKVKANG
ncbi:hypothetical protein [Gordonia soli]|uniref:Uncharacterized protein n=1 Tax=Gordonia soli NBRC 108243 TaxID=1223545 RepID=M0QRF1_9ACTN|nr:hypothetical protein [Gordonia soli]GAC71044.1 hypothetical protein GS4_47_00340 [Gordonia soli NBRC 108243]